MTSANDRLDKSNDDTQSTSSERLNGKEPSAENRSENPYHDTKSSSHKGSNGNKTSSTVPSKCQKAMLKGDALLNPRQAPAVKVYADGIHNTTVFNGRRPGGTSKQQLTNKWVKDSR